MLQHIEQNRRISRLPSVSRHTPKDKYIAFNVATQALVCRNIDSVQEIITSQGRFGPHNQMLNMRASANLGLRTIYWYYASNKLGMF